MRFSIVFAFVLCSGTFGDSFDWTALVKGLAQIIVMFIEITLKQAKEIHLLSEETIVNFTTILNNNENLLGTFKLDNLYIYGLDGLTIDRNLTDANFSDVDNILTICVDVLLPTETGVKIENYEADIGLFNLVPIYGNGNITIGIRDLDAKFCAKLAISPLQLTYLELKPTFKHSQVKVTGFWKNTEVSDVLNTILTTLEGIIAMWWDYEIDCISCVVSNVLQTVINSFLTKKEVTDIDFSLKDLESCKNICLNTEDAFISALFKADFTDILNNISEADIYKFMSNAEDLVNEYQSKLTK